MPFSSSDYLQLTKTLDFTEKFDSRSAKQHQSKGVYAIYKEATQDFHNGLARLLPKKFRLRSIDDYKLGAIAVCEKTAKIADDFEQANSLSAKEKVEKHLQPIDDSLINSLNTSIRYRQQQMKKFGDNDVGHGYILSVLGFCREVLLYSQSIHRHIFTTLDNNQRHLIQARTSSPTGVWDLRNESPSHQQDEKTYSDAYHVIGPPKPPSPTNSTPTTSQTTSSNCTKEDDLLHADDRFQCIAFLDTLDRLVGVIRNNFDQVKEICILEQGTEDNNNPDLLHRLMEASMTTNLCIECVQSTWAELTLEHPHIRHFGDLMAIVFVLPAIKASSPTEHTANLLQYDNPKQPHFLLHYIGDLVEACFATNGMDDRPALQAFSERCGLPDGDWEKEELLQDARKLFMDVTGIVMEHGAHDKVCLSFLSAYKFIGDRRCLMNTHKVLQASFAFLKGKPDCARPLWPKVLCEAGQNTFGTKDWQEDQNPAISFQDLDGLLTTQLLPELLAATCKCSTEKDRTPSPGGKWFVPLISLLGEYIASGCGTVPIHITFGVHALLLSLLSMQGNDHVRKVGEKAETAYTDMFDQLRESAQKPMHKGALCWIRELGKPDRDPILPTSQHLALWNPLIAGSICLHGIYIGSMSLGNMFFKKDAVRAVLHWYNALRVRGIVERIELLDWLDKIFSNAPTIWFAGKAKRQGDFTRSFLLGTGLGVRDVSIVLAQLKEEHGVQVDRYRFSNDHVRELIFRSNMGSDLSASMYSSGFRVIFRQDYAMDFTIAKAAGRHDDAEAICNVDADATECETLIFKAHRAFHWDIEEYGGGFVDLTAVGTFCKDFCGAISSKVGWDNPGSGWFETIAVLGELDYRADKDKLTLAPVIAQHMEAHFGSKQPSSFAFSNGF